MRLVWPKGASRHTLIASKKRLIDLVCFIRRKQTFAGTKNAPIGPSDGTRFLKNDFTLTRAGVEPAGQQGQMIFQRWRV